MTNTLLPLLQMAGPLVFLTRSCHWPTMLHSRIKCQAGNPCPFNMQILLLGSRITFKARELLKRRNSGRRHLQEFLLSCRCLPTGHVLSTLLENLANSLQRSIRSWSAGLQLTQRRSIWASKVLCWLLSRYDDATSIAPQGPLPVFQNFN